MGRKGDAATGRAAHRLGLRAETLAVLLLRLKGYRIVARRLKTPAGEIDLVVRRGRSLAVVEVKARGEGGAAAEALLPRQQRRLERAAAHFLGRHPHLADLDLRFDVVLIVPRRWPRHLADAWRP
ncbi:YraN family protein [Parvibaculum sp.]|uniref:YraN family protein n=1 Tax=Parvibaculum sp. TaxID=2024848 RepID=UPI00273086DB|nr:YraN family protein [Parvibaculum sp.]MDP1626023.1 YraN family protein [Parvibaculum sp.]MDP2149728.1 YraN family protein [Parvibaculum sp.]MDP3328793.1 YraN family protein [Parvibaculum sp.]